MKTGTCFPLFLWEMKALKNRKFFQLVPAPLVVVGLGIGLNYFFLNNDPIHALHAEHLVSLPITNGAKEVANLFVLPDFSGIFNGTALFHFWRFALRLMVIISKMIMSYPFDIIVFHKRYFHS